MKIKEKSQKLLCVALALCDSVIKIGSNRPIQLVDPKAELIVGPNPVFHKVMQCDLCHFIKPVKIGVFAQIESCENQSYYSKF